MTLHEQIALSVRTMREARGYSQAELGRRMGVTRQRIGQIEGGRENLSMNTLVEVATALDAVVRVSAEPNVVR